MQLFVAPEIQPTLLIEGGEGAFAMIVA